MLDLWQGWSFKERLLVQHPRWLGGETNKPKGKNKGKDGKDKTPANNQQQANKDRQEECEVLELQRSETLLRRLSKVETELVGCGESRITVIISSGATGETPLSGFFLTAFEEEAELNSLEPKTVGVLVTGIDSGAARSVVPAGEIPGYPVEKDSETGREYTSATGERVVDQGKQQILGTVDGKVCWWL